WWLQTRKPLVVIGFIAAPVVVALIFLEVILYGTGFAGKSLWDWLQLLIIPLVLAIGGYSFNYATSRTERDVTADNQREVALKEYMDKMVTTQGSLAIIACRRCQNFFYLALLRSSLEKK